MEVERDDPNGPYSVSNCLSACHLCNNAKSDMIEGEDFKKYFKDAFSNYLNSL